MNQKNEQGGFRYTYSAREQAEIKQIRAKYTPTEENKLDRIRRLDGIATQKAQAVSLIFGILGALILGFGMSLILSDLAAQLALGKVLSVVLGSILGVAGGGLVCLAYPMYNMILHRERAKVAPEILRLTDDLLQ